MEAAAPYLGQELCKSGVIELAIVLALGSNRILVWLDAHPALTAWI
jgi:hypothetical protein